MDALEINYRLRRLGKTQTQIAKDLGVQGGVVSNVINDRITAYGVASYIAQLLELRVLDIWPERYVFKPRALTAKRRASIESVASKEGDMT
ncbi:MAG: helix-turn-helix domain-containing protein [Burkholderiaceae bacterium]|nr:helix-turn-helix domain-containing protein [Burkholderiaceae bacterium]